MSTTCLRDAYNLTVSVSGHCIIRIFRDLFDCNCKGFITWFPKNTLPDDGHQVTFGSFLRLSRMKNVMIIVNYIFYKKCFYFLRNSQYLRCCRWAFLTQKLLLATQYTDIQVYCLLFKKFIFLSFLLYNLLEITLYFGNNLHNYTRWDKFSLNTRYFES